MKKLKKTPQNCSVEAAEKWHHKFTKILQRLEEPPLVYNSLAYKVFQIKQVADTLFPQAHGNGDAAKNLYLEIQGNHFECLLHNIAINFRVATKAERLAAMNVASCQALRDHFRRFEADLEHVYALATGLCGSAPFLKQIGVRLTASIKEVPTNNRFSLARRRSKGRA